MRMHSARAYLPAVLLAAGCALIWQTRSHAPTPLAGSLRDVLADVEGYNVREQIIGEDERRIAGMTNYVARAYVVDSTVAFTTLVSYYDKQTQGKTIHSPRNCLPGAGWEIVFAGTQSVVVDSLPRLVNRYVLKNGPHTALAYYWYQGRGRVTANEYVVKWNLLRDAALLGRSEEALVRIVIPVSKTSLPASTPEHAGLPEDAVAHRVAARLISEVDGVLPPRAQGADDTESPRE